MKKEVANLNRFQDELSEITLMMAKVSGPKMLAVFGAGHWFLDEEVSTSDIDIVAVGLSHDDGLEERIQSSLFSLGRANLDGRPVHVRFFWLDEMEGSSIGSCSVARDKTSLMVYLRHFEHFKHLYGRPWPVSTRLLPPINPRDELHYWMDLILHLPSNEFLVKECVADHLFAWHDLIKTYLFFRIAAAVAYDNYQYNLSFCSIHEFYSRISHDLISVALYYRNSQRIIPVSERRTFYQSILNELPKYLADFR